MNSLLRIRTFNIPKSCIYYANSTENNNVLLSYIIKCQNMIKKTSESKTFYLFLLFQKRALNALSVRNQHSEWLDESNLSSENVPQDVPKEADVVVIGELAFKMG